MKIKKLTSFALVLALAVAFVGCGKADGAKKEEDKNSTAQTQQENSDKNEDKKDDNNDKDNKNDKEDKDKLENEQEAEESIIVYNYDLDNEKLIENRIDGKKETPEQVFESLQNLGVIPKDAKMNSFDITEADGVETGILDVNKAFINSNLGSSAESLMLDAVAQTFIENFDIEQLQITVDGGDYESGHIVLGKGDYLKPQKTGLNQGTGEDVEADEN